MKLLVINLQNPGDSKYRNPKTIGSFMLGRNLENYRLFTLNDAGGLWPIVLNSADCEKIQNRVDQIFNR
jgi:hypothetical protein